jgi:putative selenate reductase FAD-binding subunit
MITSYSRPQTLAEALELLANPNTHPLGGGTVLSHPGEESFSVVDLQSLGLDKLRKSGDRLEIGATVTLQALLESPHTPIALKTALKLEAPLNLRGMATVAGALVTCDGRSPFAAVMLALDAKLTFAPNNEQITLGNYLPLRAGAEGVRLENTLPDKNRLLITRIEIPLQTKTAFETVARSPADKPILCAALAQWPSGRTRLAIGGWGASPALAMDGSEPGDVEAAARNAAHDATDPWATAEYRSDVAAVLARRCLEQ